MCSVCSLLLGCGKKGGVVHPACIHSAGLKLTRKSSVYPRLPAAAAAATVLLQPGAKRNREAKQE